MIGFTTPKNKTEQKMIALPDGAKRKAIMVGAAAGGSVVAAQAGASALIPIAMSTFGTVVLGVGTMHAVAGVAWQLQAVAVLPVVLPAAVVAACAGSAYWIRSKL